MDSEGPQQRPSPEIPVESVGGTLVASRPLPPVWGTFQNGRFPDLSHEDQHEKQQAEKAQADRIPLPHENARRQGDYSPSSSYRPSTFPQELVVSA
jgi:hypothetical protein